MSKSPKAPAQGKRRRRRPARPTKEPDSYIEAESTDAASVTTSKSEAPSVRFKWHWFSLLRLRWQLALSAASGIGVVVLGLTGVIDFQQLADLTLFMTLLLGIASILALVGSITFGFLIHYMQSVTSEKHNLYSRFKDGVRELRKFLDELHAEGTIDERYDYELGRIEEVTLKDFPLLSSWGDRIDPVIGVIKDQEEFIDQGGQFGRVIRGVAYRVNNIEEANSGLFRNFLTQVLLARMVAPVLKAFGTLAAVMLVVLFAPFLLGSGHLARYLAWGSGMALGFMTFLLLIEIALVVKRESKEIYDFEATSDES
jgi:hypothetical protein